VVLFSNEQDERNMMMMTALLIKNVYKVRLWYSEWILLYDHLVPQSLRQLTLFHRP